MYLQTIPGENRNIVGAKGAQSIGKLLNNQKNVLQILDVSDTQLFDKGFIKCLTEPYTNNQQRKENPIPGLENVFFDNTARIFFGEI